VANVWDCIKCGCLKIAHSLGICPKCFKPKEDDVPKATTGGGSNAAALPGETGYVEPETVAPAPAADVAPAEPEPPAAEPVKAPESEPAAPDVPPAPSPAGKRGQAAAPAVTPDPADSDGDDQT
jgi:hypothetical protein